MENVRNFSKEMDDLIDGKINKIELTREEFLDFRSCWIERKDRDFIVGHAHHHGGVTYYYEPNHDENN